MIPTKKIISQGLTGLLGAVIGLVAVACVALIPLRAQTDPTGTTCQDSTCTCQSNMKQLGLSLLQYYQDYDAKFPIGIQGSPSAGVGWFGPVSVYGFQRADYHCPSDPTMATKPQYALSYGFNSNLTALSQAAMTAPDLTISAFELSGTAIYATQYDEGASQGASIFSAASDGLDGSLLAGKYGTFVSGVTYATGRLGYRAFLTNSQFPSAKGRHYTGANYTFADGHVKFFYPDDVSSGTPAPSPEARQSGNQSGHAAGTMQSSFKATFSPI